jgi:predicted alpha-1,6-mannanase (GH76 family)
MDEYIDPDETRQIVCEVCGERKFREELGMLVCRECGTQSQQYQEAYLDIEWTDALAVQRTKGVVEDGVKVRRDPTRPLARKMTLVDAVRVALTAHVRAMANGPPIGVPVEQFEAVVDAVFEAWKI